MPERLVRCVKMGRELPGLDKPPFAGPLGQRIFDNVSLQGWDLWQGRAAQLMRDEGLSMGDPQARKRLLQKMEEFFFAPGAEAPAVAPAPAAPTGPGGRDAEGNVECVKVGRKLPGLAKPPFPGALGQRIFENVSRQGWELWESQATILMNHYGLSMADPEARKFLMKQMEEFFFGEGAQLPADWVPPTAGGKGGAKGAPAPRQK
jgi:Fe-S cluster biosynthesis and repair protein YggX